MKPTHMQTKISMSNTKRADFIAVFICDDRNSTEFMLAIYWRVSVPIQMNAKKIFFFYWIRRRRNFFDFFRLNPQRMNFILHSTKY